jgi:hypothetical protein
MMTTDWQQLYGIIGKFITSSHKSVSKVYPEEV